jgi:hypothetical protein
MSSRFRVVALIGFLAAANPAVSLAAEPIRLACQCQSAHNLLNGGGDLPCQSDPIFVKIDLGSSTANDLPAEISDDRVVWKSSDGYRHSINRTTLSYLSTGPVFRVVWQCSVATKQF